MRGTVLVAIMVLSGLGLPGIGSGVGTVTPAWGADDPRAFINELGNRAIDILGGSKPTPEREKALRDLLWDAFDFDAISRLVLGRYWRGATPEQQRDYQDAFSKFVVQTYARQLADNKIDSFSIAGVQTLGDKDSLVNTIVKQPGEQPTQFAWRVRQDGTEMKLVDVVVNGVSLVISKRSEFTSVVQHQGMDGLIQALRAKTAGATPASY